jgi:hypothetical protein
LESSAASFTRLSDVWLIAWAMNSQGTRPARAKTMNGPSTPGIGAILPLPKMRAKIAARTTGCSTAHATPIRLCL